MNFRRIQFLSESSLFHLWSAGWRQCIGFYRRLFGQSFAFINAINGSLRPPQPEGGKNHGRAISNWLLQSCWKLGTWSQWEALGRNRNHTKWGGDIMVNAKTDRNIVWSAMICACVSVFLGICSCAFVCLCVSVSVCLCVFEYLFVWESVSVCVWVFVYLCVFENLCIFVWRRWGWEIAKQHPCPRVGQLVMVCPLPNSTRITESG